MFIDAVVELYKSLYSSDLLPLFQISKGFGVMICGQILHKKYRAAYFNETDWFLANKIKSFHVAVAAQTYREGVKNLLQNNGLGRLQRGSRI